MITATSSSCMEEEIAPVHEAVNHFQPCKLDQARYILAPLATLARQEGETIRAEGYAYLANKSSEYLNTPPEPWDGAIHLEEK